ncbi:MAG TPA: TIGR02996 domain-containing protein [Gemmataceae bacterium]|nr:TIGR02996 domain-containing protein [Gemmataceae bacterium]
MNQDQALLRAVIDNPDDDGPRLVYADWLEEHGDAERAEFIRIQIAVAESPYLRSLRVLNVSNNSTREEFANHIPGAAKVRLEQRFKQVYFDD